MHEVIRNGDKKKFCMPVGSENQPFPKFHALYGRCLRQILERIRVFKKVG